MLHGYVTVRRDVIETIISLAKKKNKQIKINWIKKNTKKYKNSESDYYTRSNNMYTLLCVRLYTCYTGRDFTDESHSANTIVLHGGGGGGGGPAGVVINTDGCLGGREKKTRNDADSARNPSADPVTDPADPPPLWPPSVTRRVPWLRVARNDDNNNNNSTHLSWWRGGGGRAWDRHTDGGVKNDQTFWKSKRPSRRLVRTTIRIRNV